MNEQAALRALLAIAGLIRFLREATPRHKELLALLMQRDAEGRDLTEDDLAMLEARARAAVLEGQ